MNTTRRVLPSGRAARTRWSTSRVALGLAMGAALALIEPGVECQPTDPPQAQEGTPRVAIRHSPRAGRPFIGPADATDTLVLFTDYQ